MVEVVSLYKISFKPIEGFYEYVFAEPFIDECKCIKLNGRHYPLNDFEEQDKFREPNLHDYHHKSVVCDCLEKQHSGLSDSYVDSYDEAEILLVVEKARQQEILRKQYELLKNEIEK